MPDRSDFRLPHASNLLVTITGFDRPGVTSALFAALSAHDVEVLDIEQMVVRGRLVLGAALTLHGDPAALRRAATHAADALGVEVDVSLTPDVEDIFPPEQDRHRVVVLGHPLRAGAVGLVARCVTDLGGNIESMTRLAASPVTALQLEVSRADHRLLCAGLVDAAAETGTDIAVERSDRHRLPKRLILVDVDSTLLHGDVFGMLAELARRAGRSRQWAAAALPAGGRADRDGAEPLRARSALLAGMPEAALEAVSSRLEYHPDAPALVAAATRLGYRCGAVSAAPAQVVEPILDRLGLDLVAANRLEVVDGELTGRLVGGMVDRLGKARALLRFAEAYEVPLSQTVAVASGGDVDLLALAGLGITLQSAPVGRAHRPDGSHPPDGDGTQPASAAGLAGRGHLRGLLMLLGVSPGDLGDLGRPVPVLAGRPVGGGSRRPTSPILTLRRSTRR